MVQRETGFMPEILPLAKGRIGDVLGFLKEEPDSQRIAEAGIYVVDGEEIMPDIWYGIKGRQEAA